MSIIRGLLKVSATVLLFIIVAWGYEAECEDAIDITEFDRQEAEKALLEIQKIEEETIQTQQLEAEEGASDILIVKFAKGASAPGVLNDEDIQVVKIEKVGGYLPVAIDKGEGAYKEAQEYLEKDSDGWYWFLGKKYKKTNEDGEEEEEVLLYHKIVLRGHEEARQAKTKLEANSNVEYVIPGSFVDELDE